MFINDCVVVVDVAALHQFLLVKDISNIPRITDRLISSHKVELIKVSIIRGILLEKLTGIRADKSSGVDSLHPRV